MKRVLGDVAISATGLILLLGILAAVDIRVREGFSRLVSGSLRAGEWDQLGHQFRQASGVVLEAAWYQSSEHTALVVFAVAALVLVLFMTRT